jgi:hypothetical protein
MTFDLIPLAAEYRIDAASADMGVQRSTLLACRAAQTHTGPAQARLASRSLAERARRRRTDHAGPARLPFGPQKLSRAAPRPPARKVLLNFRFAPRPHRLEA